MPCTSGGLLHSISRYMRFTSCHSRSYSRYQHTQHYRRHRSCIAPAPAAVAIFDTTASLITATSGTTSNLDILSIASCLPQCLPSRLNPQ